jgi:hypothetical protein
MRLDHGEERVVLQMFELRKHERLQLRRRIAMAKNTGSGFRIGAVKGRSQFSTPSGLPAKRDDKTGRIMDVKSDAKPFKGVRREK